MQLSKHFRLDEFLRSESAARLGIDMTPPHSVVANLERLANEVLEPIRLAVGAPLLITSGYRPPDLNTLVGGSKYSAHMSGRAADFVALGVSLGKLGEVAKAECESLPVSQLIDEFGQWIHVAIEPLGSIPTRAYLAAYRDEGKVKYREWV